MTITSNHSWSSTIVDWATTSASSYATTLLPNNNNNTSDPPVTFIELFSAACHNERNIFNDTITTYQPPVVVVGYAPAITPSNHPHHHPTTTPINSAWMPYFEELNGRVNKYGTPTIIGFGCAGNILSVLVFFLTSLRQQSSSYYLAALGISDTCFLVITFVEWLGLYNITLYHQSGYCQTFTYMSGVFSFLSVWFVVGFTVERFIAVQYPLKRQTMCSVRRAKIVLVLLTLVASIMNTPLLVLAESAFNVRMNGTICSVSSGLKNEMRSFNYFDLVSVFIVPLMAILVLNSFIGYTVWSGAGLRTKMTSHKRSYHLRDDSNRSTTTTRVAYTKRESSKSPTNKTGSDISGGRRRTLVTSQMKVTKMLLIVSSVFVVLNMPSYVMRVFAYYATEESRLVGLMQRFSWYLYLLSFSVNFILYCLTGQNFRKALASLLHRPSIHRQDLDTQATVTEYVRRSWFSMSRRRPPTHMQSV